MIFDSIQRKKFVGLVPPLKKLGFSSGQLLNAAPLSRAARGLIHWLRFDFVLGLALMVQYSWVSLTIFANSSKEHGLVM
jgi:hypothetical protein